MTKGEIIKGIILDLQGISEINFQMKVNKILKEYYKIKGKNYEVPDHHGGDDKNDGWVVEDSIYYQIYSPINITSNFKNNVKNKFKNDLAELSKIVYEDNKWSGTINEFIFVVNTRDQELPNDSDRFYDECVKEINLKYNVKIKYKTVNLEYIKDLLFFCGFYELKTIATKLDLLGLINISTISKRDIAIFIDKISCEIHSSHIIEQTSNYQRISTDKKIAINELIRNAELIMSIIPKLGIVDDTIKEMNKSLNKSKIFNNVKNFVIDKYNALTIDFNGDDLFEKIIEELINFSLELKSFKIPATMIVIYIFDRCDIFKKEI